MNDYLVHYKLSFSLYLDEGSKPHTSDGNVKDIHAIHTSSFSDKQLLGEGPEGTRPYTPGLILGIVMTAQSLGGTPGW